MSTDFEYRVITVQSAQYYGMAPSVAGGFVLTGAAGFYARDAFLDDAWKGLFLARVPAGWDFLPGQRLATHDEVAKVREALLGAAECKYTDDDDRNELLEAAAMLAAAAEPERGPAKDITGCDV